MLTRFRVDPKLLRVSVRALPQKRGWIAHVWVRNGGELVGTGANEDPEEAVLGAVYRAAECKVPGADPDMSGSYEHPFHRGEGSLRV